MKHSHFLSLGIILVLSAELAFVEETPEPKRAEDGFVSLFPGEGVPKGWSVTTWKDLGQPAESGVAWRVKDGILHGSEDRGTWLVSDREYDDFILEYEFKLGPRGNSGCALRTPMRGDPAFDGLELQVVDLRYYPDAKPSELTGAFYRALAPRAQVYRPTQWNRVWVQCRGPRVKVVINNHLLHDFDLREREETGRRHDGTPGVPLKERPRRGHIGFQELSRGAERVQIRNARIKVLPQEAKP